MSDKTDATTVPAVAPLGAPKGNAVGAALSDCQGAHNPAARPTRGELAFLQERALEVWDVAWEELRDELGRSPSQQEWRTRALEVDRANT